MKRCPRCKTTKPLDDFYATKKGPQSYCKTCQADYQREWRQKNPGVQYSYKRRWEAAHTEEVRAAKRRLYQANLEYHRKQQREWRQKNPEKIAARLAANRVKAKAEGRYALYRHGLTKERRAQIEAAQDFKCAICRKPFDECGRLNVDHDHACCGNEGSCGRCIRGILCGSCNLRLAWYENRRSAVSAYLSSNASTT